MAHEKAIARPWAWEWDALNNIVIYQVTTGLNSTIVAEVGIADSENDEQKREAEDTADLIVTLANKHHEEMF
jgi:hypothetical protein